MWTVLALRDVSLADLADSLSLPTTVPITIPTLPDLAMRFQQLVQERQALENVVREVTPLDGLSDVSSFESHLRGVQMQQTAYVEELKRLTTDGESTSYRSISGGTFRSSFASITARIVL